MLINNLAHWAQLFNSIKYNSMFPLTDTTHTEQYRTKYSNGDTHQRDKYYTPMTSMVKARHLHEHLEQITQQ